MQHRGRRLQKKGPPQNKVNRQIRAKEVFVIDQDNQQLGVILTREGVERAEAAGLDLVEVSPNADPPVCRIMDYGKFQYEKSKRAKEAKKKQAKVVLKTIQLRSDTAEHDYQFKKRHAEEFLSQGWKVKAEVRFKGREMLHTSLGRLKLERLAKDVSEIADVEQPPRMETRVMLMILTPNSSQKSP